MVWYKKRRRYPRFKRIGIYGLRRGAGVTYFAVMLSSYMNDVCLRRTAVMQFDGGNDLTAVACGDEAGSADGFTRYGVLFVPAAGSLGPEQLRKYSDDYDCIIEDLGSGKANLRRIEQCDTLMIIVTASPWCGKDLAHAARLCLEKPGSAYVLLNREPSLFPAEFKLPAGTCAVMPTETDIFCLSGRTIRFFNRLVKGGR